jgi:hypothetical protein
LLASFCDALQFASQQISEGMVYISLALVILGPKELKKQMNIFLCLLMKELKELWQGVDTYDNHLKC